MVDRASEVMMLAQGHPGGGGGIDGRATRESDTDRDVRLALGLGTWQHGSWHCFHGK